jgi:hypothetical protein
MKHRRLRGQKNHLGLRGCLESCLLMCLKHETENSREAEYKNTGKTKQITWGWD